jgi:hypothetical protein
MQSPKNGHRLPGRITRQRTKAPVPPSRSKTFRKMAADALRAARKAPPGDGRDAHFAVASSYKSLAHDDEWLSGERQRSHKRRRAKKPKP